MDMNHICNVNVADALFPVNPFEKLILNLLALCWTGSYTYIDAWIFPKWYIGPTWKNIYIYLFIVYWNQNIHSTLYAYISERERNNRNENNMKSLYHQK